MRDGIVTQVAADGVDIGSIAEIWQQSNFSYSLSPDLPQDYGSAEFVELITAIANATGGAIFVVSHRFAWNKAELYAPHRFWSDYVSLGAA